jgi:hypothetical protein
MGKLLFFDSKLRGRNQAPILVEKRGGLEHVKFTVWRVMADLARRRLHPSEVVEK